MLFGCKIGVYVINRLREFSNTENRLILINSKVNWCEHIRTDIYKCVYIHIYVCFSYYISLKFIFKKICISKFSMHVFPPVIWQHFSILHTCKLWFFWAWSPICHSLWKLRECLGALRSLCCIWVTELRSRQNRMLLFSQWTSFLVHTAFNIHSLSSSLPRLHSKVQVRQWPDFWHSWEYWGLH